MLKGMSVLPTFSSPLLPSCSATVCAVPGARAAPAHSSWAAQGLPLVVPTSSGAGTGRGNMPVPTAAAAMVLSEYSLCTTQPEWDISSPYPLDSRATGSSRQGKEAWGGSRHAFERRGEERQGIRTIFRTSVPDCCSCSVVSPPWWWGGGWEWEGGPHQSL